MGKLCKAAVKTRGSMGKKRYNVREHRWPRRDRAGQAGPYALGPECRTGRDGAV